MIHSSPRPDRSITDGALPRPIPRAERYPEWVGFDEESRERYDLSLAIAAEAVQEPPHTRSARMAAEVVYRMPHPTR